MRAVALGSAAVRKKTAVRDARHHALREGREGHKGGQRESQQGPEAAEAATQRQALELQWFGFDLKLNFDPCDFGLFQFWFFTFDVSCLK